MLSYGYLLPTRGVVFSSQSNAELTARSQADIVQLAQRAESMGFESVWIGDSVLAKPRFEPLVTLGAVAEATDSVTLGTAVYLAGLRHPVHVAHQTATLDRLAGGRVKLGVGVGVRPIEQAEAANLGIPFHRRGAQLNEALDIIHQLWTGETISVTGEFFELEEATIGFGPDDHIPIYVAAAAIDPTEGFPPTIRERLQRYGDGWIPITLEPDEYTVGLEQVRQTIGETDRDPDAITASYYLDVVLAATEEEAIEEAREFYLAYYRGDPDHGTEESEGFTDAEVSQNGIFGPPAVVAERIREYDDAGVEELIVRFVGENQRQQLRRFQSVLSANPGSLV